jgi:hypothetical protein
MKWLTPLTPHPVRQALARYRERMGNVERRLEVLEAENARLHKRLFVLEQEVRLHVESRLGELDERCKAVLARVGQMGERYPFWEAMNQRLVNLLTTVGHMNFGFRDPDDPTARPPLGYPSWDYANFVYRPAFQQAVMYLLGNDIRGPVAEFGTYQGFTAGVVAEVMKMCQYPAHLYLYDSFEGLPDPTGTTDAASYEVIVKGVWTKGAMALEPGIEKKIERSIAAVLGDERIHITKGFFDDTLDEHLPAEKLSLVHVDCDYYSSAKLVLDKLAEKELLQDGCVVLFDDYNCNASNPNMGERAALRDFLEAQPRWRCSPWFAYGWHGHAFIFHDTEAAARLQGQGPAVGAGIDRVEAAA